MANNAEEPDAWSSDSGSSEDESEDELRAQMEFHFGGVHPDSDNEEQEEPNAIDQGTGNVFLQIITHNSWARTYDLCP